MSRGLELEEVVKAIEAAFKPLDCVVEVFDYRQRLRFRVFDPNEKPLLTVKEALLRHVRDPEGLNTVIAECRSRLERKGYRLKAWNAPAG